MDKEFIYNFSDPPWPDKNDIYRLKVAICKMLGDDSFMSFHPILILESVIYSKVDKDFVYQYIAVNKKTLSKNIIYKIDYKNHLVKIRGDIIEGAAKNNTYDVFIILKVIYNYLGYYTACKRRKK